MRHLRIALAALAVLATPAIAARDHLVPEDSFYAAGRQPDPALRGDPAPYKPLFDNPVVARLFGAIAMSGEFGFGLRQENGRVTMHYIERDLRSHVVADCEAPLDPAFASDLATAWRKVTLATRFSKEMWFGLDGATYHFFARNALDRPAETPGGPWYGQVWSPDPGTPPETLIVIATGLGKACTTHDKSLLPPLAAKAAALAQRPQSEF
jgi:hypothetical protein